MLIEISEVILAMGSIRGQIWTDWRQEATFLPIDPTDLKAGIQGAPFFIATNTGRSTSISLISW